MRLHSARDTMKTSIPSNFEQAHLVHDVVREAKDYALCNGIIFRSKQTPSKDLTELAPFSVFPSPFPASCFNLAKSIQKDVNLLMLKVAYDYGFLESALENTIRVDEFTRDLFRVHSRILRAGSAQQNTFGLFRADYMADTQETEPRLRQVEVNVISSSFAIMGPKLTRLHQHIVGKYGGPNDLKRVPENNADENFARAFITAWETYGNANAIILVAVEDYKTINISDQRSMEFLIGKIRPDIKIFRRSFKELVEVAVLKDNQLLFIDNNYEVGLVYFRFGYDPSHYPSQEFWDMRTLIEKSKAIKCPTVNCQLAGAKKMQQVLFKQDVLEKFLDVEVATRVRSTFAGLWGLDLESNNDVVDMVLANPERYVMKPQREGGGNNTYGIDIPKALIPIKDSPDREAFIIMERIMPPQLTNILVTNDHDTTSSKDTYQTIDSELGIYGSILGNRDSVVFNYEAGHVLRSKRLGFNEGGVSSGQGVIDSPFLY